MPRFVQMVRREGAAAVLQLPAGRTYGGHVELHMRLLRRAATFFQVAGQARGGDIFPAGNPAQTAWDDVIEGQVIARSAILALELVAQEQVESGECGIFGGLYILAQRDDRRDFHVEAWAVHMPVVVGDNVDLVEKHCLYRGLPWPQAQRIIAKRRVVRIQHQSRAIFRMPRPASCFESSGMQHKSNLLPLSSYML